MTFAIAILAQIRSIGTYFALSLVKVASKREPSSSLEWPSESDLFKVASKREPSSSLEWPSVSDLFKAEAKAEAIRNK